jgi:hypothetical protein
MAVGLRRKLTINQRGDRFEQEADRMADYVVIGRNSMAPSTLSPIASAAVQREDAKSTAPKPDNYDEALKKILEALQETEIAKQLKAKAAELGKDFLSSVEGKVIAGSALGGAPAGIIASKLSNDSSPPAIAPPIVSEVLADPGQPLDAATRRFMEQRFGHSFGHVRIHTDAKAAESTHAVNAQAYTVGCDVVFGPGRYAPETTDGQKLLAHELTHVLQQTVGPAATQIQRKPAPDPANPTLKESDKSWIKAFGLRKWLKGIISDWQDIQARYAAATLATFHPTEGLLTGILAAARSRIDLGEEQIKTELNGDPAILKEFRDAYRKMISAIVPKFASLTGKTAAEVFQAHRREIPDWALPATTGAATGGTGACKTLSFADFNGTPPQGATKAADTEYDYTPKTIKSGDTVTAVFDGASSWVQTRYAHPTDRKATGLDKEVSDCQDFLKKNSGGSWDGPTATGPPCPAAAPFPNTAGIKTVADCDLKIGQAIEKWQSAESPRVLKHEQFHMNLACTLADKATKALASGKDPGTVGSSLMAQDKAARGDYDNETNHGCKAAEQTKWEGLITAGLTKYPVP